jgi:hypothetical protein
MLFLSTVCSWGILAAMLGFVASGTYRQAHIVRQCGRHAFVKNCAQLEYVGCFAVLGGSGDTHARKGCERHRQCLEGGS